MTGRVAETLSPWPHYFGPVESPLFGCYHPGAADMRPQEGVVICGATGHEYMGGYRAMRQMAVRLAQAGWPALRFDFFGTGDSAGNASAATLDRWVYDIAAAEADLRARTGRSTISFLGLRLGASLALQHLQSEESQECPALVLWDPVIDGREYLADLSAAHRSRFGGGESEEILGTPFPAPLRAAVAGIDLLQAGRPRARRVLIVETGGHTPRAGDLEAHLRRAGAQVSRRSLAGAAVWREPNKAAVPQSVIQSVVAWMKGQ